ncbi:unnamed protein product [Amoebophrya sp. A25]|nr:unnamed protein product [Amoebophrya sp. A25]|eukprot:GSA25T00027079001.1
MILRSFRSVYLFWAYHHHRHPLYGGCKGMQGAAQEIKMANETGGSKLFISQRGDSLQGGTRRTNATPTVGPRFFAPGSMERMIHYTILNSPLILKMREIFGIYCTSTKTKYNVDGRSF